MGERWNRLKAWRRGKLDACSVCGGLEGGVPGNENVIDGVVMCDYCHVKLHYPKTREIVICGDYGGFMLSPQGLATYCSLKGIPCFFFENSGDYYSLFTGWPTESHFKVHAFDTADVELIKQDWGNHHISPFGSPSHEIRRDDPALVDTVKLLGKYAGEDLKIVSIPTDVEWEIQEYDGNEWVAEKHRRWS